MLRSAHRVNTRTSLASHVTTKAAAEAELIGLPVAKGRSRLVRRLRRQFETVSLDDSIAQKRHKLAIDMFAVAAAAALQSGRRAKRPLVYVSQPDCGGTRIAPGALGAERASRRARPRGRPSWLNLITRQASLASSRRPAAWDVNFSPT